jgi:hypothetical protein
MAGRVGPPPGGEPRAPRQRWPEKAGLVRSPNAGGPGGDKQMFGDEPQIPHGEQNDEEADCHDGCRQGSVPAWSAKRGQAAALGKLHG